MERADGCPTGVHRVSAERPVGVQRASTGRPYEVARTIRMWAFAGRPPDAATQLER